MITHSTVRQNTYYDSVTLMLFSSKLKNVDGVEQAAVMMGTDHNKYLMISSGILTEESARAITPNDLVIGILAQTQASLDGALSTLERLFEEKKQPAAASGALRAKTLDSAMKKLDGLNFTIISLPGKYAKSQALKALENGIHVLLFSDNVTIQEELELKNYAVENNLLMMGPDCGTAIINGVALGFANVVRRGNIGLVAAAGTGLQEVTVIIDRLGGGISQALGTGGRDLKEAIGGKMMMLALEALHNDPQTQVIGIISKPPAKSVMEKILAYVKTIHKPVVACFLGGDPALVANTGAVTAQTLEDAASFAVALAKGAPVQKIVPAEGTAQLAGAQAAMLGKKQKYIRGLFSGGTLCYEAMLLLQQELGPVYSNVSLDEAHSLADVESSRENTLLDMGDDYFTDGMPHPMIDTRLRAERIKKEAADPETAVLLLDCVLGYGSHEDPAGALVEALEQAKKELDGRKICVVASVCGTDADLQNRGAQEEKLRGAGVVVMPSNAQAARIAAAILAKHTRGGN